MKDNVRTRYLPAEGMYVVERKRFGLIWWPVYISIGVRGEYKIKYASILNAVMFSSVASAKYYADEVRLLTS